MLGVESKFPGIVALVYNDRMEDVTLKLGGPSVRLPSTQVNANSLRLGALQKATPKKVKRRHFQRRQAKM